MSDSKTPKIRFYGFDDEWEQRGLTSEVELFNGLTYSPNDIEKSGTLVLRSSNVKNGEIVDADNVYVNPNVVNCDNVKQGDIIVVVRNGSRALIGKHAEIKGEMDNTVIGAFMTGLRSENYSFINSLLDTTHFSNEVEKNLGATINQITNGMFAQMEFMLPKETEQTKIGEFFKTLDNLSNCHQRKYEKLVNVKKSMLGKMFPKNGENVPEIRFDGFSGDWKECELGEVAEAFEYGLNAAAKEFDGKNKYLRITDIDEETNEFLKGDITSPNIELINQEKYILKKGDLLFARTGASVGKTYLYQESDGVVYYAGFLIKGNITEEYNDNFIFQNTKTESYKKFIRVTSQRSGQPGVNAQEYASYKLNVASLSEQTKIGTFFTTLDNLIACHQRELEKLKSIKKSMLEKMFV